jgi:hypothetical protein
LPRCLLATLAGLGRSPLRRRLASLSLFALQLGLVGRTRAAPIGFGLVFGEARVGAFGATLGLTTEAQSALALVGGLSASPAVGLERVIAEHVGRGAPHSGFDPVES